MKVKGLYGVQALMMNWNMSQQDIVLGFHPPFLRKLSEYAVS
ncbi:element excision factor XisI family protein [Myxacorys almedinensis]|uniref:Uncharacterized protein n=1 Tax=Myxacorys almedinensis A TaxID=2690445 RepID=A0A8J7Z570_9CYAN|nr:element excision factor XisI family protein [Myxacorys almedinensis]NDJ18056.1 hypothetical protein [Myxacorys almedinensis A]